MVEAGEVELVIKDPKHPYSQLLVNSIPHPDPNKMWDEEEVVATTGDSPGGRGQCLFVDRCPHAMDMCRAESPPKFHVDQRRAASCFLYADTPTLEEGDLSSLMNSSVETAGSVSAGISQEGQLTIFQASPIPRSRRPTGAESSLLRLPSRFRG